MDALCAVLLKSVTVVKSMF